MGEVKQINVPGVSFTPLKIIERDAGNIMHALKSNESSFKSFGEAYFTFVKKGAIKGWKRHREMTLNLIVPLGEVKFVLMDDRKDSPTFGEFYEIILSRSNYGRLTIEPGIWIAFKGVGHENMILNLASIPHDPDETVDENPGFFNYNW